MDLRRGAENSGAFSPVGAAVVKQCRTSNMYSPPQIDRIWDILDSYYTIPKAIFYLLDRDCTSKALSGVQGLYIRTVFVGGFRHPVVHGRDMQSFWGCRVEDQKILSHLRSLKYRISQSRRGFFPSTTCTWYLEMVLRRHEPSTSIDSYRAGC